MKSRILQSKAFQVILVAVVLFAVDIANSLRCFNCKGPDDGRPYPQSICENEQTEVTCPTYDNRTVACGKYHHEINSGVLLHEVEGRACVPQDDCYWIGMSCRAILMAGGDCQYACCHEDLCNNVSSLSSATLVTAICSIYFAWNFYVRLNC